MKEERYERTQENSDNSKYLEECEFVKRLISQDRSVCEKAWNEFFKQYSRPIAYFRTAIPDVDFTTDDFRIEIYLYLTENDNKRLKGFYTNLDGFFYNKIRGTKSRVQGRYKNKHNHEVSDPGYDSPHIKGEENSSIDDIEDYHNILKQAFSLLWQNNTQRAYIYMMRRKMEIPSKQVAEILGISVNNVDVVLKRAENEMKNILEEIGINEDILLD